MPEKRIEGKRDELTFGIYQLADTFVTNPIAEKSAAGRAIAHRLADYGTAGEVTRQGLTAESADINGILRDLSTPPLDAAARLIGAGDWLAWLARVQEAFETKSGERTEAGASRRQAHPTDIKTLRTKAHGVHRNLCHSINLFNATEEGAGYWPGLEAKINTLIAETKRIVAARKSGGTEGTSPAA